ncbi:MAG: type II toxin-antitoxin system VapC family toxin [Bacteroidetes bacterium]|nr:MAG: type II toxin-antitoxin system VapC family toxin [Bacteroidota bacterium]
MNVLLDTHILIWLLEDNQKLNRKHRIILEDTSNQLFVSQYSFIEIAIKLKLGKLPIFNISIQEFISEVENIGIQIIAVENSHLQTYQELPLFDDHRDPFDRLIISTAIYEKYSLASMDAKFLKYSDLVSLM